MVQRRSEELGKRTAKWSEWRTSRNDVVVMYLRLSVSRHARVGTSESEVKKTESARNDAIVASLRWSVGGHSCVWASESENGSSEWSTSGSNEKTTKGARGDCRSAKRSWLLRQRSFYMIIIKALQLIGSCINTKPRNPLRLKEAPWTSPRMSLPERRKDEPQRDEEGAWLRFLQYCCVGTFL